MRLHAFLAALFVGTTAFAPVPHIGTQSANAGEGDEGTDPGGPVHLLPAPLASEFQYSKGMENTCAYYFSGCATDWASNFCQTYWRYAASLQCDPNPNSGAAAAVTPFCDQLGAMVRADTCEGGGRDEDAAMCSKAYIMYDEGLGRTAYQSCSLLNGVCMPQQRLFKQPGTNLRTLDPPEWCNSDAARREDAALCENAYVTSEDEAGAPTLLRCAHVPELGKCVADDDSKEAQFDDGTVLQVVQFCASSCEVNRAGRADLQSLTPHETCNSAPRRDNAALCESAYMQQGDAAYLCIHSENTPSCASASRPTCCLSGEGCQKREDQCCEREKSGELRCLSCGALFAAESQQSASSPTIPADLEDTGQGQGTDSSGVAASDTLVIGLGVALGLVALCAIALLLLLRGRRKQKLAPLPPTLPTAPPPATPRQSPPQAPSPPAPPPATVEEPPSDLATPAALPPPSPGDYYSARGGGGPPMFEVLRQELGREPTAVEREQYAYFLQQCLRVGPPPGTLPQPSQPPPRCLPPLQHTPFSPFSPAIYAGATGGVMTPEMLHHAHRRWNEWRAGRMQTAMARYYEGYHGGAAASSTLGGAAYGVSHC